MSIYSDVTRKNDELVAGRDDCDYTIRLVSELDPSEQERFWSEVELAESLAKEHGADILLNDASLECAFVEAGLEPFFDKAGVSHGDR